MSIWKNLTIADLSNKVNDIHLIITKHREDIKIKDLLQYIQDFKFMATLIELLHKDLTQKYEDICSFVDQSLVDVDQPVHYDQIKEFATTVIHTKKLDHHIDNAKIVYSNTSKTYVIRINNRIIDGVILDLSKEIPWSSWIYNPNPSSTKITRKVGGSSTIKLDLARLSKKQKQQELELRKKQLMHDILVYMQICEQL